MNDSAVAARRFVSQLREGRVPTGMSLGFEIEGGHYDQYTDLINPFEKRYEVILHSHHREYMASTFEYDSHPLYHECLNTFATTVGHAAAQAVLDSNQLIDIYGDLLVFSSTFEAGNWVDLLINQTPGILRRSHEGRAILRSQRALIPSQTLQLYRYFISDFDTALNGDQLLPWPAHGLHVHSGIPGGEEDLDLRLCCVLIMIRHSVAAKVMSFVLFNTCSALSKDLTYLSIHGDARAIFRRLVPTARGFFCPYSTSMLESELRKVALLKNSPGAFRIAKDAIHDRVRLRFGSQHTVESIDAPMTPDLRAVIAWILFCRVLDAIALDFLAKSEGNEALAANALADSILFRPLPTTGGRFSSCRWDTEFNRALWDGSALGLGCSFRDIAETLALYLERFEDSSWSFKTICDSIASVVRKNVDSATPSNSLSAYLGVDSGRFLAGHGGYGPISRYKSGIPAKELVFRQSEGTILQAKALARIRDLADLREFVS